MRAVRVIAAAVALSAALPGTGQAERGQGLGLVPPLPSLQAITPTDMTAGLLGRRSGKLSGASAGIALTKPLAVADALSNAKCVALLNYASGEVSGSINQVVDVSRFIMNCR